MNIKLSEIIKDGNEVKFTKELLNKLEEFGFASFNKADFEAFLYFLIEKYKNEIYSKNNLEWIDILKITPSKLRSLQLNASIKFKNIDDESTWNDFYRDFLKSDIEIEDLKKGTVRFYLENVHLQRLIEKFVIDNRSSLDYSLNRSQVILKYEIYLKLLITIKEKFNIKDEEIGKEITKDKSFKKIESEFKSAKTFVSDLKDKFKDKAIDEIAKEGIELLSSTVISFIKKKLGIN